MLRTKGLRKGWLLVFSCLWLVMAHVQASVLPGPVIYIDVQSGTMETNAELGGHVAIDGQLMAASMPGKGDVLIYEYNGMDWQLSTSFNMLVPEIPPSNFVDPITSLAIQNDRILVGSTLYESQKITTGAAFLYERINNEWTKTATIEPMSPNDYPQFGQQVAFDADRILVGAPRDDDNGAAAGAVYVFKQQGNAWIQTQKLVPADVNSQDSFGTAIGVDAGRLLVGAPRHDYNAAETGAAYLYEYNGNDYLYSQKLLGSPSAANSRFGQTVDVSGDLALVGAPEGFNDFFLRTGSVYVFRYDGVEFQFEDKMYAGTKGEDFGQQLALAGEQAVVLGNSGLFAYHADNNQWLFDQWIEEPVNATTLTADWLVAGIPTHDQYFTNDGKVMVYGSNGNLWDFASDLMGFESNEDEQFGYDVALAGDHMLVSALNETVDFVRQSAVKVLAQQGEDWEVIGSLLPSDSQATMSFGTQIVTMGDEAFIAAVDPGSQGAVYVFQRQNEQWIETQKLTSPNGFADDGFGYEMSRLGDFLFVGLVKNSVSQFSLIEVFKFNGLTWDHQQTLSSGIQDDFFGYELVTSGTQLLVAVSNNSGQHNGPILVFEEVSPDDWQMVGSLPAPTGEPFLFDQLAIDADWLVASEYTSEFGGTGGGQDISLTLYLFQRQQGQWIYMYASEPVMYYGLNGLTHELSFQNEQVLMAVGYYGFFGDEFRVRSYFFEQAPSELTLVNNFVTTVDVESSVAYRVAPVIHDQWAYVGFPGDTRNGQGAGSVMTFDLDPPDFIFASDFETVP